MGGSVAGIARIPIDEAISIIAERGLPNDFGAKSMEGVNHMNKSHRVSLTLRRRRWLSVRCWLALPEGHRAWAQTPDVAGNRIDQLIEQVGISPQLGKKMPLDLMFIDADGHPVRLGDY